jgi:hypothetical protein
VVLEDAKACVLPIMVAGEPSGAEPPENACLNPILRFDVAYDRFRNSSLFACDCDGEQAISEIEQCMGQKDLDNTPAGRF